VVGRWFSPDTPVSSTNETDCHDMNEILLKVALNTIIPTKNPRCFETKWKFPYAIYKSILCDILSTHSRFRNSVVALINWLNRTEFQEPEEFLTCEYLLPYLGFHSSYHLFGIRC
jgi:hypothetical protein